MSSQGPLGAGTAANDAAEGNIGWLTNSGYLSARDGDAASVALPGGTDTSQWLKATNFGFSIPGGSTIDGVVVEFADGGDDNEVGTALKVKLIKGGTIQGNDKGDSSIIDDNAYHSFGGVADKWGLTLTDTDVNASDFGVALRVGASFKYGGGVYIDHVRITVYYTASGATITGSGTPAAQSASTSGAGIVAHIGAGTTTAQSASTTASGLVWHNGAGTPAAQNASTSGAGVIRHNGSGAAAAQSATTNGDGLIWHIAVGVLSAQAATTIGTGNVGAHGTGEVAAQAASVSGAGIRGVVGAGEIQAQSAGATGFAGQNPNNNNKGLRQGKFSVMRLTLECCLWAGRLPKHEGAA